MRLKKPNPPNAYIMLYRAGWRITQGTLVQSQWDAFTHAACGSDHLIEGNGGGMTLLVFLPSCFIPNVLHFCDEATCINIGTQNLGEESTNSLRYSVLEQKKFIYKTIWKAWRCSGPKNQAQPST